MKLIWVGRVWHVFVFGTHPVQYFEAYQYVRLYEVVCKQCFCATALLNEKMQRLFKRESLTFQCKKSSTWPEQYCRKQTKKKKLRRTDNQTWLVFVYIVKMTRNGDETTFFITINELNNTAIKNLQPTVALLISFGSFFCWRHTLQQRTTKRYTRTEKKAFSHVHHCDHPCPWKSRHHLGPSCLYPW